MTRFLSNYIYNKYFQIFCLLIFIIPCKNYSGETKLQEKLDLLHSSLSKISNEEINKENLSFVLKIIKETYDAKKMGKMIINYNWKNLSWGYSDIKISDQLLKKRFSAQNEMFERIREKIPNLKIIDPLPVLINADGYYYFKDNNNWIYYDDDHISANGARKLKPLFHFLNSET